jgi:hypothetical protein
MIFNTKNSSDDHFKEMRVALDTCGGNRRYIQVLVGKLGGKRPLERPRHRWEDKIEINPQEVEWGIRLI